MINDSASDVGRFDSDKSRLIWVDSIYLGVSKTREKRKSLQLKIICKL